MMFTSDIIPANVVFTLSATNQWFLKTNDAYSIIFSVCQPVCHVKCKSQLSNQICQQIVLFNECVEITDLVWFVIAVCKQNYHDGGWWRHLSCCQRNYSISCEINTTKSQKSELCYKLSLWMIQNWSFEVNVQCSVMSVSITHSILYKITRCLQVVHIRIASLHSILCAMTVLKSEIIRHYCYLPHIARPIAPSPLCCWKTCVTLSDYTLQCCDVVSVNVMCLLCNKEIVSSTIDEFKLTPSFYSSSQ